MPDLQPLYQRAAIIRDAVLKWENTANRVGSLFYDILSQIQTIDTGLSDKYLRKDIPDSAKEKITFEKGLQIGTAFAPGLMGGNIDERGNGELESLTVRSFLKVWDLIINRLTAVESDYIFSEADTIDEVVDLGQNTYRLTLRKKWDGYFTAQVENNVIFGVVNTLASGSGGDYYTSWMRVLSVNTSDNMITVVAYPHNEVPGNTNFAPVKGMVVARKGNSDSPLDGSRNERQDFWNLSSSDGRISFLRDVAKPILEEYNYALSIGRLPALQKFKGLPISDGEMAVYAKYIVGENFFTIDKEGRPVTQEIHRGAWNAGVATSDPYRRLVHESQNEEGVVSNVLAVHTVYHRGMKWACLIDRTLLEPTWNSPGWQFLEGNDLYSIEFHSSAGSSFFADVNTVLTARIIYGTEDITESVIGMQATDIQWTRNSGNIPDDNAWLPAYDGPKNKLILTTRDMGVNWRVSRTTAFTVTFFLPIGDIITESISFNI